MMSKTQTMLAVLLIVMVGLLVTTVSLKVLPFSAMNNLLVAGWFFPIFTTSVLIAFLRGCTFAAIMKWCGGGLLFSLAALLLSAPL